MFAEVLICDGCRLAKIGPSLSRGSLEHEAQKRKWLNLGEFRAEWLCPTCRITFERNALVVEPELAGAK